MTMIATSLSLYDALVTAGSDYPKCFEASRDGHCIAVEINGQAPEKLSRRELRALEKDGDPRAGAQRPSYQLGSPISGPLNIDAEWIDGAGDYFGPTTMKVLIYPLDGQRLSAQSKSRSCVPARGGR